MSKRMVDIGDSVANFFINVIAASVLAFAGTFVSIIVGYPPRDWPEWLQGILGLMINASLVGFAIIVVLQFFENTWRRHRSRQSDMNR